MPGANDDLTDRPFNKGLFDPYALHEASQQLDPQLLQSMLLAFTEEQQVGSSHFHPQPFQTHQAQYPTDWQNGEQAGQSYCQQVLPHHHGDEPGHEEQGQTRYDDVPRRRDEGFKMLPLSPLLDQASLPRHQAEDHEDSNQQSNAAAMAERIKCNGCDKLVVKRSMYNHTKICPRLVDPNNDERLVCGLPVPDRNPPEACSRRHRSETALRDHKQTVHHYFQPGKPGYEKRDTTRLGDLLRYSRPVLSSRVALEGAQLQGQLRRLTNAELSRSLADWVGRATQDTKDTLARRLILIRKERQGLGLDILE